MSVSSRSVSSELVSESQGESLVADRRVLVDGVDLQYLEAGSGPPLLLVHGHEQSAASWRWVIPVLARTHRVLALSLPGHGDSAPAVGGYAPGSDLAPLVADFFGELAIMISRMPGGDVGRTSMSTAMLFAQPSRVPAEFFTEQHALGRRPGQLEASTAMARALFDANGQREVLLDQLPTLTMPTLIIWGGCDYVLPASQAQAAVDRLPHGRLALLADCGHLPHAECPDRFATVLGEWLAEHHDSS
jgi:pimeloyl-ACP methyl ester carboxylesterase